MTVKLHVPSVAGSSMATAPTSAPTPGPTVEPTPTQYSAWQASESAELSSGK